MILHVDRLGIRRRPEICAVCGKRFERSPEHVFKQTVGGRELYACSWTCRKKQISGTQKKAGTGRARTWDLEKRVDFCRKKMEFYEAKMKVSKTGSRERLNAYGMLYRWRCELEDAQAALSEGGGVK